MRAGLIPSVRYCNRGILVGVPGLGNSSRVLDLLLAGGSGLLEGDPAIVGKLALVEDSSRSDREGVDILFGVTCPRADNEVADAEEEIESIRLSVDALKAEIWDGGKLEGRAAGGELSSGPFTV